MKKTEDLCREIVNSINRQQKDLEDFVDFMKVYMVAIKLAFRCDRATAWEIIGQFMLQLERIGSYTKRYDAMIAEIAALEANQLKGKPLTKKIEIILEASQTIVEKLEADRIKRLQKVKEKKRKNTLVGA